MILDRLSDTNALLEAEVAALEFETEELNDLLIHEYMSGQLEVSTLMLTGIGFDPLNSLLLSM